MIKKDELIIDLFKDSEEKFKQHLQIENNERIIFSGKFGHGKTTFLREFFELENQRINFGRKKYNVISLYPVNYSIASNEDIFKYIKYDIILEMLKAGVKVEEVLFSQIEILPKYLQKNALKIIGTILSMIPKIGKDAEGIFTKCVELVKNFKESHKQSEHEANGENILIDFFDDLEQKEGSIYEDNIVSKTIEKLLLKNKEEGNIENILLVDDLDRIDPEHIFRILNVFSAHFDRRNHLNSKNKFGFDKIIVVCDIDNIRNIFKAKYGANTDFNGYIDKFYSYEIFDYSLTIPKGMAYSILFNYANWSNYHGNYTDREAIMLRNTYFEIDGFFMDIVIPLIDQRQIDMRSLLKWKNLPIPIMTNTIFSNGAYLDDKEYPIFRYLKFLCMLKGDIEGLKDAFNNINIIPINKITLHKYIWELLYILTILDHNKQSAENIHYHIADLHVVINAGSDGKLSILKNLDSSGLNFDNKHLIWLIIKALDFLKAQNVL